MTPVSPNEGSTDNPDDTSGVSAYDIVFEDAEGALWHSSTRHERTRVDADSRTARESLRAGWTGALGPGIGPQQWPRGTRSGLPMLHVLSLWVPPAYRRRGPGFPGFSLFQGEGDLAEPYRAGAYPDPFVEAVRQHIDHPQQTIVTDLIGGQFAFVWLTEAEMSASTAPPPDVRRPGEHTSSDGGVNAWESSMPQLTLRLTPRHGDLNAGLAPTESESGGVAENGYRDFWDTANGDLHPWARELQQANHLGGTLFPAQSVPDGLTPFYLCLDQIGGMNIAGGRMQVDLESGILDWASD